MEETAYRVQAHTVVDGRSLWYRLTDDLAWDDLMLIYGDRLRTEPERYRAVRVVTYVAEIVEV